MPMLHKSNTPEQNKDNKPEDQVAELHKFINLEAAIRHGNFEFP